MARPREVLADVLASADEVAQRLLFLARDANERQAAGGELAHQPLGVTRVGLDPIGRLARNQPRRADTHVDAHAARRRASVMPVGPAS